MRLTLTEVKQRVSKLVPENIDYDVDVEAGSIAIITKQPEAFGGAGQSLTVKIAKNICSQKSLLDYVDYEIRPGIDIQSNEELDEVIRNTAESAYHPSCTNKMGTDHYSVVDQKTKVHGIENLRVIDASIMPDIVSANLNASVVMIAERAADFLLY